MYLPSRPPRQQHPQPWELDRRLGEGQVNSFRLQTCQRSPWYRQLETAAVHLPEKGSDELVNIGASSRGPELFMDVARLTSMQVEKDRAIGRAQDARSKGLATESIPTRNARIASNRRQSVDKANSNLANPESFHKHGRIDANIASAMASFGISYDGPTRPVEDNKPSPHDVNETEKERKRAEHKRRKRMRRQLEHERVIRETPMEEYS